MTGYMGQILVADLTKNQITSLEIDNEIANKFLGGSGYAARILYDLLDPTTDPLSPENMLLFMAGPLTGTLAPCTGRHVVCGKSPITNLWGESHAGGHFGTFLKFSGYDGILVKGRAEKPVTLHIENNQAKIIPAENLWGKTTDSTQEALKKDLGRVRVACIGPAGENLVKFASIVNAERVAARCGFGAVMGSKHLKAIAVGGKHKVPLYSPDEFKELAQSSKKILGEGMSMLTDQGTAMYVDIAMMFNDMPIKYFQEIEFDDVDLINAKSMENILTGRIACYSCPIGCGRKVSVPEYDLVNVAGPEFQTLAAFGSNLMISDLNKIALMNSLCNEYGMDTISCGSTIAFATHLSDIGKADYGLTWNDPDRVIDLIHAIAKREGIGNELAEGSVSIAQKHSAEDIVLHVRGMEIPNHDPRAFSGMTTVYTTASRGASHMEGDIYSVDMGADVQELGIIAGDRLENDGKGKTAARVQEYRAFFDSVIMCHFAIVPPQKIIDLLNYAMGASYQLDDLMTIGARAVTMKRLFNLRCGLKTSDERLPTPLLKPHAESVTDDFVPDVDAQLKEYYEYRQWNRETGRPTEKALQDLEMIDLQ
ncbi:MAG: aldehyde ferredoxin oxidoreductase [Candidatus Thorarchaeota archaeon]|nr:MAG: aldehyde ferredoxin oxidoreductase [Candidatus Thorarchaeota archaeon]